MAATISDKDLGVLIRHVGRIRGNQDSTLPEHLSCFQSPDDTLTLIKTELTRRSPPLTYETGIFAPERGLEDSLFHQRPMTLVQTIKFQDPSYVRFVQRHLGYPMTGKIEDVYSCYAKYHDVVGQAPSQDIPPNDAAGFLKMCFFNPKKFIDVILSLCVHNPDVDKEKLQQLNVGVKEIEITEPIWLMFIKSMIESTHMPDPIFIGWTLKSGNLKMVSQVLSVCLEDDGSGNYLATPAEVIANAFHTFVRKAGCFANMGYVKKCYRLFTQYGFSLTMLNRVQVIKTVSSAVSIGNVPFTEQFISWIRKEVNLPNLREVLWTGLLFGSIRRNDFVNMEKYHLLLQRHYPESAQNSRICYSMFLRGSLVNDYVFTILYPPDYDSIDISKLIGLPSSNVQNFIERWNDDVMQ